MMQPTWIICQESDSNPSTGRNTNRVSLNGINKIEAFWVLIWVIVPKTLTDNKEVKAMQMERVTLSTENAGVLHHELYTGVEGKNQHLCSVADHGVVGRGASVVEWKQWFGWKVRGVNSIGLPKEVCLKKSSGWLYVRNIVN